MTDMDSVLTGIEAHLPSSEFKARLLAIMARCGLYSPPRASLLHYRAEAAASLLIGGHARPDAREILRVRFGVSRRTAYRLLDRGLNLRQGRLFD
ncbi:MAG: hypothetical protein Q8O34_16680 [Rhodocyclaceae bacterium]|nr:hypothetical protein [Rhodocyclaceae bacterium]